MKKHLIFMFAILVLSLVSAFAQEAIRLGEAKFHVGDNMEWKSADFNDSRWQMLSTGKTWDAQGITNNNAYAWYRFHFVLPEEMLRSSDMKETLRIALGEIDDVDEAYLNGMLVGKTGSMPQDKDGYQSAWNADRVYAVSAKDKAVRWGQENVLAVRVYNGGAPGGMFLGAISVSVPSVVDDLAVDFKETKVKDKQIGSVILRNTSRKAQKGMLHVEMVDAETEETVSSRDVKVALKGKAYMQTDFAYDIRSHVIMRVTYKDNGTGRSVVREYSPAYILTPAAPLAPRYNGPLVYGVRPGSPVIFRIPTSGERPMRFSVKNMPEGLQLDAEQGVLSGSVKERGTYKLLITAENAKGRMEQELALKVGDKMALTPPMGWNSWNCWGLSVSQERVMSSASAIIEKGLADYGYSYINVDDAWESAERNADGTIGTNGKFPDMAGLGTWLHEHGLKFGIYSSPGDRTCGGYLGSLGHEKQDAETFNAWGVDYLKYDWCGYYKVFDADADKSVAAYVRPYLLMEKYLREQPRDIFYSLCQYGMADVWKWGHAVDANSWRTTGDITDTWESLYDIGFVRQRELYRYAQPGHWNDPDMLIVGKVGWSDNLRDTRLTPDEQYSHISLWALLASNMLIGCDVAQIDDFTIGLLCNNEVNAVNQDILGQQAKCEVEEDGLQIWKRPLYDGSYAIGIFNLSDRRQVISLDKYLPVLGISRIKGVRDLWRQQDLNADALDFRISSHGVKMLKVRY